jgi:hypothetical protein
LLAEEVAHSSASCEPPTCRRRPGSPSARLGGRVDGARSAERDAQVIADTLGILLKQQRRTCTPSAASGSMGSQRARDACCFVTSSTSPPAARRRPRRPHRAPPRRRPRDRARRAAIARGSETHAPHDPRPSPRRLPPVRSGVRAVLAAAPCRGTRERAGGHRRASARGLGAHRARRHRGDRQTMPATAPRSCRIDSDVEPGRRGGRRTSAVHRGNRAGAAVLRDPQWSAAMRRTRRWSAGWPAVGPPPHRPAEMKHGGELLVLPRRA